MINTTVSCCRSRSRRHPPGIDRSRRLKTHYTIPLFIPDEGCPFTCIFCSQKKISGRSKSPTEPEIVRIITEHLATIPRKHTVCQAAFFGGSFTGLPISDQKKYLGAIQPFIKKGLISGIRLSTRPDYIDAAILKMLKKFNVTAIELGVQSLSEDVLKAAKRGHTADDVRRSSSLIRKAGFILGHQFMVGLPNSTPAKERASARLSIAMKAREVRIYPLAVIKGTPLERMWRRGEYRALGESQAIKRCASLVEIFRSAKVKVLRCGLHPSEGLLTGRDILAGAFHQAFGQKVEAYLYGRMIEAFLDSARAPGTIKHIIFNPRDAASVIGYRRQNALRVESRLARSEVFVASEAIPQSAVKARYLSGRVITIGRL